MSSKLEDLPVRFQKKILVVNGHWLWTGSLTEPNGYGQCEFRGEWRLAHRAVYTLLVEDPGELTLDHVVCPYKNCVNPDCLEPVTQRTNILRSSRWPQRDDRETHCPQGHEYNEKNTYYYKNGINKYCRICARKANKEKRLDLSGQRRSTV